MRTGSTTEGGVGHPVENATVAFWLLVVGMCVVGGRLGPPPD